MDRRILEKMYSHTQKKECCRKIFGEINKQKQASGMLDNPGAFLYNTEIVNILE